MRRPSFCHGLSIPWRLAVGMLSISLFVAAPPATVRADEPDERGGVPVEPLASHRLPDGRYPDLRAVPSLDVSMGTEVVGGRVRYVLRFPTEIWNAGPGPLELIGVSIGDATFVYQRVFGASGGQEEYLVGRFVFHPVHNHWHFEEFALHELWRMDDYERWLASGRAEGQAGWRANKTTGGGEPVYPGHEGGDRVRRAAGRASLQRLRPGHPGHLRRLGR